jgi:hypothetical protein
MRDFLTSVEKLRRDAAEAGLVRDLATDNVKRELYARIHDHLNRLADEVEGFMNDRAGELKDKDMQENGEQDGHTQINYSEKEPAQSSLLGP